jgi:hypothetical protein
MTSNKQIYKVRKAIQDIGEKVSNKNEKFNKEIEILK